MKPKWILTLVGDRPNWFTDLIDDFYIKRGAKADPDNPEWTNEDFAKARPAKGDPRVQEFLGRGKEQAEEAGE